MTRRKDVAFPVKPKRPEYNETTRMNTYRDRNDIYSGGVSWMPAPGEDEYHQARHEYSEYTAFSDIQSLQC